MTERSRAPRRQSPASGILGPLPELDLRRAARPAGGFVAVEGETYYRIAGFHLMPPFLMSIPSDGDLWMFLSSRGGLTAGRVDADGALFPYETVDKLHDGNAHSGPITLIRLRRDNAAEQQWQPFSDRAAERFHVERSLYKNVVGNRVIFEEVNRDLELTFRYRWTAAEEFGWIRSAALENLAAEPADVEFLDGFRNVIPYGAPLGLYQQSSSLVDAYKRADIDPRSGIAIYSLTAGIVDRPEAVEVLRANTVLRVGLPHGTVSLAAEAIGRFRRGEPAAAETVLTGRRGNYLVVDRARLAPGEALRWHLAADVGRGHADIAALGARLRSGEDLERGVEAAAAAARENLLRLVAGADGVQSSGHPEADAHHFANVLFNSMRGGVFVDGYRASREDLEDFLEVRNRETHARSTAFLEALPAAPRIETLLASARAEGDVDLERLCLEYLPLFFSRRHGDPSRPWNRFAIRVRGDRGERILRYEGNWRDLFQNWEGLAASFPGFLPGMIARFVNASTVDGFNPYRITRDGIDWETVEPHDPWSHIGYWGDHQIVYLLRLLEALDRTDPDGLRLLGERPVYSYADVPYRLASYADIVRDPRSTIEFDRAHAARVEERVRALGADGKLVPGPKGGVLHVSLLEKLLVPALAKLSNLVPDGGIWMNTQRPEWNDANNALVGDGVSVVTLCHLRRYLRFLEDRAATLSPAVVSREVVEWLREVAAILAEGAALLESPVFSNRDRRRLLDALGESFSRYRERVYAAGLSRGDDVSPEEIAAFCRDAVQHVDHAIRANRRDDGLYHSYNLLSLNDAPDEARIGRLTAMLEGQVAALSSGLVAPREAVTLVDRMFESPLYRPDRASFLLYPERTLPGFLEKNAVPREGVLAVPLLRELLEADDRSVLSLDADGVFRFHPDFRNARDLAAALDRLAEDPHRREAVARDRAAVLALFEEVFRHREFTGRSGTMYGYEGLGCVYWHMVAKLLLAVQEIAVAAECDGAERALVDGLARAYYRIRAGIGYERSAEEYGAFPTDPYSHTPPRGGAQQPGMTGQVKEEILTRFGELGVRVENGAISFHPFLLRRSDFRREPQRVRVPIDGGGEISLEVPESGLAFTYCGTPVIFRISAAAPEIRVIVTEGEARTFPGERLDRRTSRAVLERTGEIERIEVDVPDSVLFRG